MATICQDFRVPPPMYAHGPPPMAPMAIWELHFEKRITQMLSAVTTQLMTNMNNLSDKLSNMEKTNQDLRKNLQVKLPTIPPLMQVQTKPLLPTPPVTSGNNRPTQREPAKDGRGPTAWGPNRARPYQPRYQGTQKPKPGGRRDNADKPRIINQSSTNSGDTKGNTGNRQHSENGDFQKILKGVHKFASIGHHKGNWIKTPPSITKNITRITDNIKPPLVDDEFSNRVRLLGEQFAEGLSNLVQEHLNNKEQELEKELMLLNPADKKLTLDIVKQQFVRKQGNKFDHNKMKNLITTAVDIVGFNFTSPRAANSDQTITTFNRFQCLELEEEPDTEEDTEENEDSRETRSQGAGSERNSTPPSRSIVTSIMTEESPNDDAAQFSHDPTPSKNDPHLTTTRNLRSRKITSNIKPTPQEYDDLRNKKIFIYPNKTRPSTTDLSNIPNSETEVLIVADSNLQFAREIPRNWELLSVSGLKIESATSILQDLPEPQSGTAFKHVIIAVGINDRRDSKPPLADCVRSAAGRSSGTRTVSFLEVVDPGSTRTKELNASANIQRLNQAARSATNVNFVPAPCDPTFHGAGFHFDAAYTEKIIQQLNNHIVSLNC